MPVNYATRRTRVTSLNINLSDFDNYSDAELARIYGCTPQNISHLRKKYGKPKFKRVSREQKIVEYLKQNAESIDINKLIESLQITWFGEKNHTKKISKSSIINLAKNYNVQIKFDEKTFEHGIKKAKICKCIICKASCRLYNCLYKRNVPISAKESDYYANTCISFYKQNRKKFYDFVERELIAFWRSKSKNIINLEIETLSSNVVLF